MGYWQRFGIDCVRKTHDQFEPWSDDHHNTWCRISIHIVYVREVMSFQFWHHKFCRSHSGETVNQNSLFFPVLYQKRLKKEKRTRRRVQEQLEAEVKKRAQYEEALRSNSAETLRLLNGNSQAIYGTL